MRRNPTSLKESLRAFIIIVIVLGVFFRCVSLEQKIYWFDEAATTTRILDLTNYLNKSAGQILTIEEVHRHQFNPINSFNGAIEGGKLEPQLPPLYYVMLQSWMQLFGGSITAIRSMSVVINLLAFPCIYWLCLELFQSSLVGWIAVALIAVSPIQVLYAQEARMYSLHAVLVLLSSAALLRAMRVKTKFSWIVYSIALVLGLYTHTIFTLVAIGHGIYAIASEGFRLSKIVVAYLVASLLGLIGFIPWLIVIFTHFDRASSSLDWMNSKVSKLALIKYWGINLSRLFLDITPTYKLDTDFSSFNHPLLIAAIATILTIIVYSIYFICRHSPKRVWLFNLTLIGVTALTLALPDILFGGYRSNHVRYLIASYTGIYLIIAYLLATKIFASASKWQQKLWQIAMIFLISCGVLSNTFISQAQAWWNKSFSSEILPIARIINQTNSPLVIVDSHWWSVHNFWSLSTRLEPKARIELVTQAEQVKTPEDVSDVFLFTPGEKLYKNLTAEHKIKIVPIYQHQLSLWQLKK